MVNAIYPGKVYTSRHECVFSSSSEGASLIVSRSLCSLANYGGMYVILSFDL